MGMLTLRDRNRNNYGYQIESSASKISIKLYIVTLHLLFEYFSFACDPAAAPRLLTAQDTVDGEVVNWSQILRIANKEDCTVMMTMMMKKLWMWMMIVTRAMALMMNTVTIELVPGVNLCFIFIS